MKLLTPGATEWIRKFVEGMMTYRVIFKTELFCQWWGNLTIHCGNVQLNSQKFHILNFHEQLSCFFFSFSCLGFSVKNYNCLSTVITDLQADVSHTWTYYCHKTLEKHASNFTVSGKTYTEYFKSLIKPQYKFYLFLPRHPMFLRLLSQSLH